MRNVLWFRTIWVDTLHFPSGQLIPAGKEYKLFEDNDEEVGVAVIKENEEAIINWLLCTQAKFLLLDSLGLPRNPYTGAAIRQPVITDSQTKPGDIDLLLCPPNQPEFSVAIQCNRVTVEAEDEDNDQVRKLGDIKDVVLQATKPLCTGSAEVSARTESPAPYSRMNSWLPRLEESRWCSKYSCTISSVRLPVLQAP